MWKRLSIAGPQSSNLTSEMGESSVTETTATSKPKRMSMAIGRPSIAGLMLSKKFAKRLSTRVQDKRGLAGSPEKEPSYRMEPVKKFNSSAVEYIIKDVLDDRLENFKYNPKFCANMTKVLGDEIKDRVKGLGFDRYKIVSVVVLSQKKEQAMTVCSRCAWDNKNDNYASYAFQNMHIVCTATVYGIYRE